jgi:hypothetical protein
MIIKATKVKSIRHAGILAVHLLRTDDNETVKVLDIRGTARPDDVAASLRSMQRATELTRGKTGLFHVAINPRDTEADNMTSQQWERCLRAIEDEFKLWDQPCVIVEHRKENRTHRHAVFQLTDTESRKLIDIKHDYFRCITLGLQLEKEFCHELTDRQPSRDSYTRKEQQQAKRLGEKVKNRRTDLRNVFANANDADEFKQMLEAKGYTLAQGDRAAVVLVDNKGEVLGLARELGVKVNEIKSYLGVSWKSLPTIEDVRELKKMAVKELNQEKDSDVSQDSEAVLKSSHLSDEEILPITPYQQNVKITFNTRDFETAVQEKQLQQQKQRQQEELDKKQRIAEKLQEWEAQQKQELERRRKRGLSL